LKKDGSAREGHDGRIYAGRQAALATMHGKEQAIAGPLLERLGLSLLVPPEVDTDVLGTFTGEVPRPGRIEETAIAKARMGMQASGLRIGIASEGSYGPHPQIPFVAAGIEIMVLVDDERGIVVREKIIDENPVYDHALAASMADIEPFLRRVDFPRQALIVRPNTPLPNAPIHKGVADAVELASAIAECARLSGDARAMVQTDMRAHMNPSRMHVIARLAAKLADRIATQCPDCATPGFGVTGVELGLPCKWCGGASTLVQREILECAACDHVEKRPRPDGLTHADPAQCPSCNP
jgi:hypothetical protein